MKNILYIILLGTLFSCSISRKQDQSQSNSQVIVALLNDIIQLPDFDGLRCVDTLYFEIQNNSKYDYYYATPDSSFIFNRDMIECAGVEFFDEDSLELSTFESYGFSPEVNHRPFLYKRDINVIPALSTKTIKMFLKFPNVVADFEPLYQFVQRIKYTKTVNIIFKSNMKQTQKYLNENKIKLKSNEKLLNVHFEFQRPVKLKCKWDDNDKDYTFRDRKSRPSYNFWNTFVKAIAVGDIDYLVKNSMDSIEIIKENYTVKSTDIFKGVLEKNNEINVIDTFLLKGDAMSFDQFFKLFEKFDEKGMILNADSLDVKLEFDTTKVWRINTSILFTEFSKDISPNYDDFYITHGSTADYDNREYYSHKVHYMLKCKEIIYTIEEKDEKLFFREMKIKGRQYLEKNIKLKN